ncbi:Putative secretion system X protein GspD-like protein [Minicystis rosea]|nr:Putative secretion system X protein GspD-like protein [Minicystis rosea]
MMDLESLARFHAALTAGATWDDLFRRERVTRAQWLSAERAWLEALSAEAAAGRFDLADRYLRALAGMGVEALPPAPPAPEIKPAPTAPSIVPALPPMPAIPAAMLRFTDVQTTQDSSAAPPSSPALPFDRAAARAPSSKPAPPRPQAPTPPANPAPGWMPKGLQGITDLEGTRAISPDAAPTAALPFAEASAAPAAASPTAAAAPASSTSPQAQAAWLPKGMRGFTDVDATQMVTAGADKAPPLPFAKEAEAAKTAPAAVKAPPRPNTPAPAAWMPKGMAGMTDVDGTQMVTAGADKGAALPFAKDAPAEATKTAPAEAKGSPPAPPRPDKPATAAWMPKAMAGFADVDGTQMVTAGADKGAALPFPSTGERAPTPAAAAPPRPAPVPAAPAAPVSVRAAAPAPIVAAPASTPAPIVAAPASAPMPAPASVQPRLSLEAHARLCVELAAYPGHRAEVLRRYSIDEEQGRQADAHWTAQMKADASLRRAWEAHCSAHQAWVRSVQGGTR